MGRFRRITLGRAMVGITVCTLVMALFVQSRRAAEREARYRADIARLRALITPDWLSVVDGNPKALDEALQ